MRISRKKDDAGYAEWMHILQATPQIEHLVEIKFDGEAVPVAEVVTADSETGVLITLVEGMEFIRFGEVAIVIPGRTEQDEEAQRQVKRVREIVARFVERLYATMQVYDRPKPNMVVNDLIDAVVLMAQRAFDPDMRDFYVDPALTRLVNNTIDLIMKEDTHAESEEAEDASGSDHTKEGEVAGALVDGG